MNARRMFKPVTPEPKRGVSSRLLRWTMRRPGLALLLYWPLAAAATHVPPLRRRTSTEPPLVPIDKIAHFAGFALLSWLLVHLLTQRMSARLAVLVTALVLAAYGALDELTQPPFQRSADPWDFIADMVGCFTGIGLALLARDESRQGAINHLRDVE